MTPSDVRVLVACEFSGVVRSAFRRYGFAATSCDLTPAADGSPHHVGGDVRDLLGERWDLVIAHPPCTYLCRASTELNDPRHLLRLPDLDERRVSAVEFFSLLLNCGAPRVAVENPVPLRLLTNRVGRPSQIYHPCRFGDPVLKETCLWLRGLPPLNPTTDRTEEVRALPSGLRHRGWWISPSPDRGRLRSITPSGVAEAMARQWGAVLLGGVDPGRHILTNGDR